MSIYHDNYIGKISIEKYKVQEILRLETAYYNNINIIIIDKLEI